MAQLNKQERKDLLTRAGMAGSSSRTGPDDPRHRRGAQSEMEVEQRFDPDDFEVDDKQRVKVKKSGVAAQAVCCSADADAVGTSLAKVGLGAATTSTGTYVTVDITNDNIGLLGGSVYTVEAEYEFQNASASNLVATLALVGTDGTSYGSRAFTIRKWEAGSEIVHRNNVWIAAVVDLSSAGAGGVEIQVMGSGAAVVGSGGWVKAQRIG